MGSDLFARVRNQRSRSVKFAARALFARNNSARNMLARGRGSRVTMSTPAYYRAEAARCRELAAKSQDTDAIKRWLRMAAEYEQLAESMASVPHIPRGPPQVQCMPMQQQIQQQQAKTSSDKDG